MEALTRAVMALLGGRDEAAGAGMTRPDFRKQSGRTSDRLLAGIPGEARRWHDILSSKPFSFSPGKSLFSGEPGDTNWTTIVSWG